MNYSEISNLLINRPIHLAEKGHGTSIYLNFDNGDYFCFTPGQWFITENNNECLHSESPDSEMENYFNKLKGSKVIRFTISFIENKEIRAIILFDNDAKITSRISNDNSSLGVWGYRKCDDMSIEIIVVDSPS